MRGVRQFMNHLNISQNHLANLLKVSRSTISMFETDKRTLTTEAWDIYRDLQVRINEVLKEPLPQNVISSENAEVKAIVKDRLKLLKGLLYKEKQLLKKNTERYERSVKAIALLNALKPKGKKVKPEDLHWWNDRILMEKTTLRNCNKQTLAAHRLKIGAIEGEMAVANGMVEEV